MATIATSMNKPQNAEGLTRNEKSRDTRHENIVAARAVADAIRTSLGPRGMDKMIQDAKDNVIITNDGATIMKEMTVVHPAARMLVEMSRAQDIEAGDGTTSVVIIAGALLRAAEKLLAKGLHAQTIVSSFLTACDKATEILREMSIPINLEDTDSLVQAATTSLCSKIVSQNTGVLAPMAVEAVLRVTDIKTATNVDLRDIKVVKKLGGTIEDTELVDGLVFTQQRAARVAGGPTRIENAKIGLIQFCISPPKTDMENNITIKDYQSMDRLLREERVLTATLVKKIAKTGCNVLLIQKSILRDAVSDLALDYLSKLGILVIKDIEREDVDTISRALHCQPVASIDHFTTERLGSAKIVCDELLDGGDRITKITGVPGKAIVSVLVRASNTLMLDEAERSIHDALCVVRSLIKTKALVPGGGAPEMEMAQKLYTWSTTLPGKQALCVRAYSEALEVIPYTLAENAGLCPMEIVTVLRAKHMEGDAAAGINVKKGSVTNMTEEHVLQPLLNSISSVTLATETVMVILKIDDVVITR